MHSADGFGPVDINGLVEALRGAYGVVTVETRTQSVRIAVGAGGAAVQNSLKVAVSAAAIAQELERTRGNG